MNALGDGAVPGGVPVVAGQLKWRRAFPYRALRRLAWAALGGATVTGAMWLLFGAEPDRLATGTANPLARIPAVTAILAAVAAAPPLVATVRRPRVAADHYALSVRPGCLRTLLLPWAGIAELAGRPAGATPPLLLVRLKHPGVPGGSRVRWFDRYVLRRAGRDAAVGYDLAVRMDEFAGPPAARLAELTAWVPRHVGLGALR
jgi:hypothetical protein